MTDIHPELTHPPQLLQHQKSLSLRHPENRSSWNSCTDGTKEQNAFKYLHNVLYSLLYLCTLETWRTLSEDLPRDPTWLTPALLKHSSYVPVTWQWGEVSTLSLKTEDAKQVSPYKYSPQERTGAGRSARNWEWAVLIRKNREQCVQLLGQHISVPEPCPVRSKHRTRVLRGSAS